MEHIIFSVR